MFCKLNSVPDFLCSCAWVLGLSSPPHAVDAEYSPAAACAAPLQQAMEIQPAWLFFSPELLLQSTCAPFPPPFQSLGKKGNFVTPGTAHGCAERNSVPRDLT